jgi:hypothetical protein
MRVIDAQVKVAGFGDVGKDALLRCIFPASRDLGIFLPEKTQQRNGNGRS